MYMPESQKKNFKKKLIIILAALAALLLIMYLLTLILPAVLNGISEQDIEEGTADYNFYDPDFDENIYDDIEYLKLIENGVVKYDNASNSVSDVTKENASSFGDAVSFLYNYVYTVIEGDTKAYNALFSEKYFENNSPKEAFTMQKIYNCTITYYATESGAEEGNNYTKYIYKLKYNIYKNNGSFRTDIGEDAKTQYIVITDREGKLLIDSVSTSNYKLPLA